MSGLRKAVEPFSGPPITALAGSILITGLTTSFLTGIQQNPAVPAEVKSQTSVELAGGVPSSGTRISRWRSIRQVNEETARAVLG